MFDHVGLKVNNLDASRRFYTAALAPLGYVIDSSGSGFGPKDEPALWLYESTDVQGDTHVALRANSRSAVDRFHRDGLKAGGRDHGAPGLRADYSPNYYAAFLLDPDGNNVEAVCFSEGR
ncbi:VOC family protein [Paraburkholderia phenazinium]|jgi:catechol 2,3-dioxygenase-like lactoylglutathione lyase family enzyme|uniref:Predicted lactoylglutathione lyase n=1 Tax=Paraburkholderia phenazinium TaxID=60549 RepID=A0A1G8APQ2_9BURK|nr:VOC family protein [Paraburkholderia phenazinium]SDH22907.1 Predicted lactoylglutathione lyase [Paraburkholderia phenazinium]